MSRLNYNNKNNCFLYRLGETCGGSLTEFPGTFRTPVAFKRRIYPHNQDCEWTITADENTIIYLVFDYFLLEDSTDCIFDALEVSFFYFVACGACQTLHYIGIIYMALCHRRIFCILLKYSSSVNEKALT